MSHLSDREFKRFTLFSWPACLPLIASIKNRGVGTLNNGSKLVSHTT